MEYTYNNIVSEINKCIEENKHSIQNDYSMYGANQDGSIDSWCGFTFGHSKQGLPSKFGFVRFGNLFSPDAIMLRKEIFMIYVKHTIELMCLIKKYNAKIDGVDITKIDKEKAQNAYDSVKQIVDFLAKYTE